MKKFTQETRNKKTKAPFLPKWGYVVIGSFLALLGSGWAILTAPPPAKEKPQPEKASDARQKEETFDAALPEPPPKVRSEAEILVDAHAGTSSPIAKTVREIARLAKKENLWVSDFEDLAKMSNESTVVPSAILFLKIFGKPDAEYLHTENYQTLTMQVLRTSVPVAVTDYTYYGRILNPTTEKREDLTVSFALTMFCRAKSTSGHVVER